jgi:hypothetical protein
LVCLTSLNRKRAVLIAHRAPALLLTSGYLHARPDTSSRLRLDPKRRPLLGQQGAAVDSLMPAFRVVWPEHAVGLACCPHDGRVSDTVVVGYRTQALALPHHADGFALLVRSQLWLGSKSDAALLGGSPPPIGTSKDAASFVLGHPGFPGWATKEPLKR